MTDTIIREAIASSVADVLERMFFLEPLGEAAEPPPDADLATVRLTFDGDPPGCFQLRIARPAADSIAADFLGEDADSLTPRQSADVTCELCNMICGAVLSRIESRATFRLGAPQIVVDGAGEDGPMEENRYTVETGSGTLSVAIRMETPSCSPTERYVS